MADRIRQNDQNCNPNIRTNESSLVNVWCLCYCPPIHRIPRWQEYKVNILIYISLKFTYLSVETRRQSNQVAREVKVLDIALAQLRDLYFGLSKKRRKLYQVFQIHINLWKIHQDGSVNLHRIFNTELHEDMAMGVFVRTDNSF